MEAGKGDAVILYTELLAQQIREQTERRIQIEKAERLLDEALILAEGGMPMEACNRTGMARELAQQAGLI